MERGFILIAVLLSILLCGNVWAVDDDAIQELQTDVSNTKSKADKNKADIESLKSGLPAVEDRVSAPIEDRLDSGEFQGPPANRALRVKQDPLVLKEQSGRRVRKVNQVQRVKQDLQVIKVLQD